MQSSRTLMRFDCPKRGKLYDEDLTAGGRLERSLDSVNVYPLIHLKD